MIDEQGKAYAIECNGNAGTGIIKITGHNHFTDLVKFIEKKLGKESKDTKVESTEKAQIPLTALEEQALKKQLRDEKEMLLAENDYLRKQAEDQERRKKFPGLYKMLGM
jgi:hypothetical protein